MTVLETIQRGSEFLAKKGVDSPRLQAELLLAHVLKLPRMQLYLNFERGLTPSELESCRELVKRRGQREPLQYIVGTTSFCGVEIAVNPHVLIPRPETEILAELAWSFLERVGRSAQDEPKLSALDFGTGSGCLAVAVATKCPGATVVGLDSSEEALELARGNAASTRVGDRIRFVHSNGFSGLEAGLRFDLIVSNPPYIPTEEIASLQPEVRDFEPRQALDGGEDGLDYYRLLACQAGRWLSPHGRLMCEFGDDQAEAIRALMLAENWIVEGIKEDYTRRSRIMIARLIETSA